MKIYIWWLNRLKAMSIPELLWRFQQITIQKIEQLNFSKQILVIDRVFSKKYEKFELDASKLKLNTNNHNYSTNNTLSIFGKFNYSDYRMSWHAGFQTVNQWPLKFSHSLNFKQRDDIGDARTNWELNRHFQFAILAKNFYATGNYKYLDDFIELFVDWNEKNPFLWGISWTSVLEIAIRVSNWSYAYCFLKLSNKVSSKLLEQLRVGIINMTEYISRHYSRYSSANNHLIIEAYAIGQTGILLNYKPWINLAISIISREIYRQFYSDGINKELSLHYQAFSMEAIGLLFRILKKNDVTVPECWNNELEKMCKYVVNCLGEFGEVIEFGDNDEGKILDLSGQNINYYQYVLLLLSHLLPKYYANASNRNFCENISWLYTEGEQNITLNKKKYQKPQSVCFREGGNSILKSVDQRVLIGIDHADLGFGSIAAHGHADALSFQMFIDGNPILIDPGTYIYHSELQNHLKFRKTENHNTICINKEDQSELLGAFLWGRKAKCKLITEEIGDDYDVFEASHNGYLPINVIRKFIFEKRKKILQIEDLIDGEFFSAVYTLNGAPALHFHKQSSSQVVFSNHRNIGKILFSENNGIEIGKSEYSRIYGSKEYIEVLKIKLSGKKLISTIFLE